MYTILESHFNHNRAKLRSYVPLVNNINILYVTASDTNCVRSNRQFGWYNKNENGNRLRKKYKTKQLLQVDSCIVPMKYSMI